MVVCSTNKCFRSFCRRWTNSGSSSGSGKIGQNSGSGPPALWLRCTGLRAASMSYNFWIYLFALVAMTSEYRESVGVWWEHNTWYKFCILHQFCTDAIDTDATGASASNLHASTGQQTKSNVTEDTLCDVGQKTIVFVTFHMISRGKGLGIGAKIGAFSNRLWRIGASAIYCDVAMPEILFVKMPTNRFVQTSLTIKWRKTTKWRILKCIGVLVWKIVHLAFF